MEKVDSLSEHKLARRLAQEVVKAIDVMNTKLGLTNGSPAKMIEVVTGYDSKVTVHLIIDKVPETVELINNVGEPVERLMNAMFGLGILAAYKALTQKVN